MSAAASVAPAPVVESAPSNAPATNTGPAPTQLTQAQIDFFWQNGYLKFGSLLTESELELYRGEYDRIFNEADQRGGARNLTATKNPSEAKPKQRMLQIINMCNLSIPFRKLIQDKRILDVVQDLIGPNIMLFHDQALNKPAHTGGPVFWHQDNAYWKCRPATLLSCWMTLDDVDIHNGAMQVIPGSHLTPVWHGSTDTTDSLIEAGQIDTSKAVANNLPAGGIMFHHCQTLHYTAPNETDRQRRAFAIHFMTPGTRDRNGQVMETNFDRPVLRMRI